MDTVQLVLLIVILALTLLLVILGIQVFMILREVRKTITKANRVLDNTGSITESVSRPIQSLSSLIGSASSSALVARLIKLALRGHHEDKKDKGE